MEKQNIIKIRLNMKDPKGFLIPRGITETLTVIISDEVAVFNFKDNRTTKRFASLAMKLEEKRGVKETIFIERIGKATTGYPNKKKEDIRDLLLDQFKEMGLNAKNA